jgi:hypothetical protein
MPTLRINVNEHPTEGRCDSSYLRAKDVKIKVIDI